MANEVTFTVPGKPQGKSLAESQEEEMDVKLQL